MNGYHEKIFLFHGVFSFIDLIVNFQRGYREAAPCFLPLLIRTFRNINVKIFANRKYVRTFAAHEYKHTNKQTEETKMKNPFFTFTE